jgi:Tfp pilus assembly protein PilX
MLTRVADERGSTVVTAMLVMFVLVAFATTLAAFVDADQADSRRERERESSFNITEGALNAQIYQLSTRWPSATATTAYPAYCTADATHADCPNGTAMRSNFTTVDHASTTTEWETQVRDNGGASPNFWSDDLIESQPSYDANDDNFLWVRASGVVRGRTRVLVALVEAENVTLNFPRATLVSGHFETSNNGNKVIIDTNGVGNQFVPGDIIVRCALTSPGCASYDADKGQIAPNTVKSNPQQPRAVSVEALDQLRERAKSEGNYYAGCAPSLAGDHPGELVFMENADACQYNGNTVYNTAEKPGYVVIARGTIAKTNGTADFHGIIYHANLDNVNTNLITLTGNVSIFGSIVIDGPGGLSAGSSKVNLVYDPNVFNGFKAFGTAGIVQNTFREITPPAAPSTP